MNVAKVRNLGLIQVVNNRYHGSCLLHKPKDNNGLGSVVRCASWSTVTALERELETEMNTKDQSIGLARFRHKYGEGKSVVEMLECLEIEAIMGDDVGKEPVDYNRRAQIFDRSSRVFQALKELNSDDTCFKNIRAAFQPYILDCICIKYLKILKNLKISRKF
ncbi:hypothetical protein RJT34_16798 [Clitoria ternatea]|uniref:Uncharacterized protein n=1 Tax=Clitoria ternatea TaxID=43366 RepID=A0AAN9JAW4_CLITE